MNKEIGKSPAWARRRGKDRFGGTMRFISALLVQAMLLGIITPYQMIHAQGTPIPGLSKTDSFKIQDMDPTYLKGEKARNQNIWEGLINQGLSVLQAGWESQVDAEINRLVNAVNQTDKFNSVDEYRDYVRKSLEGQKQEALSNWQLAADASIRQEREEFLQVLGDKKLEDSREKTALELKNESRQIDEQCAGASCADVPDSMNRNEAMSYLNQVYDDADQELQNRNRDWRLDMESRTNEGNRQFTAAQTSINLDYADFLTSLDATEKEFQANIKVIDSYEQKVRDGISSSVTGMKTYLASNGLFYEETCDAQNVCTTDMNKLNVAGQEFSNLINSLDTGLKTDVPLTSLAGEMQTYMQTQQTQSETRRVHFEEITRGEETLETGINIGNGVSKKKYKTSSKSTRKSHPPGSVASTYKFGNYKCTQKSLPGRGNRKGPEVCSGTGFSTQLGTDALVYNYTEAVTTTERVCGGRGGCRNVTTTTNAKRTKTLGKLTDLGNVDWTDHNGAALTGVDMDQMNKRAEIQHIIKYNTDNDTAFLDNMLLGSGETRKIEGIVSADVCGDTNAGKSFSHTCYTAQNTSAFAYTTTDWHGGTRQKHYYYGRTETSLKQNITYKWYDKNADHNEDVWQDYRESVTTVLDKWTAEIIPAITDWEAQATNYKKSYADWKVEADAQKTTASVAYLETTEDLRKDRIKWENEIQNEYSTGLKKWKQLKNTISEGRTQATQEVQSNFTDKKRKTTKLAALTKGVVADVLKSMPAAITKMPDVGKHILAAAAKMPELQKEFLEKSKQNLPDIRKLGQAADAFQSSLTGMMNLATAKSLDSLAENARQKTITRITKGLEGQGFDVTVSDKGMITATREIYSGKAKKFQGKGMSPADYEPRYEDQVVNITPPESVKMADTGDLFAKWDMSKVSEEFINGMQENDQEANAKLAGVGKQLQQAEQFSQGRIEEYQRDVKRQIKKAIEKQKRKSLTSTIIKAVVAIAASAVLGPGALALMQAAMALKEGGLKAAAVAVVNSYTSQFGVSLSYSKDGGFGAGVGYGGASMTINQKGQGSIGYDVGGGNVGLNFDGHGGGGLSYSQGGASVGLDYSEDGGFGASAGYDFGNGVSMNAGYSETGGGSFGGNYAMAGDNGSHNMGLNYSQTGGLSGSYDYTEKIDHGQMDLGYLDGFIAQGSLSETSKKGFSVGKNGLDINVETTYSYDQNKNADKAMFTNFTTTGKSTLSVDRDGMTEIVSSTEYSAEYQQAARKPIIAGGNGCGQGVTPNDGSAQYIPNRSPVGVSLVDPCQNHDDAWGTDGNTMERLGSNVDFLTDITQEHWDQSEGLAKYMNAGIGAVTGLLYATAVSVAAPFQDNPTPPAAQSLATSAPSVSPTPVTNSVAVATNPTPATNPTTAATNPLPSTAPVAVEPAPAPATTEPAAATEPTPAPATATEPAATSTTPAGPLGPVLPGSDSATSPYSNLGPVQSVLSEPTLLDQLLSGDEIDLMSLMPAKTGPSATDLQDPKTMTLDKDGTDMLLDYEKFKSEVYNDGGDTKGFATTGYGHLIAKNTIAELDTMAAKTNPSNEEKAKIAEYNKYKDKTLTKTEANTLFVADAAPKIEAIQKMVTTNIDQNTMNALTSLTFNAGENIQNSSLIKTINKREEYSSEKDWRKDVMEELDWYSSGGEQMNGLIKRRLDESIQISGGQVSLDDVYSVHEPAFLNNVNTSNGLIKKSDETNDAHKERVKEYWLETQGYKEKYEDLFQ